MSLSSEFLHLRTPAAIAVGLVVGISLLALIVFLVPRKPPVAVPQVDTIECVLYWKNAPAELRGDHLDDECAVSVLRRANGR